MHRRILIQFGFLTAFFVALIVIQLAVSDSFFLDNSAYFLIAIAGALALALSWRWSLIYLGGCVVAFLTIRYLNEAKVSLTEMPLTFLDLRIAFANPSGFLGAMKISVPAIILASCAISVVVISALGWRLSRLHWPEVRRTIFARAALIVAGLVLTSLCATMFAKRLEAAIAGDDYAEIANMPDGLVLIAKKIGAVPFLALTASYDASTSSPFRELATRAGAMAAPSINLPSYINPLAAPERMPDIFTVLLESTFDLPKVFDVTPKLRSPLFPNAQQGQLQGELGVNAIGGGTWISEFEVITGIPSRLFGYAGYYTHVELAPYVKASLATYLKEKGYKTLGLYPVEGTFYGARAAYARYGFHTFIDGVELGIEKPWYAEDTDIMSKYIDVIQRTDQSSPLFAFALTMENHSPHPCTRFASPAEMPYRFAAEADPRATCELNEYIARYHSTEAAIAMLETALRAREKATGRPYVLAVFGDHQPNSFTGTAKSPFWSPKDYSKLRHAPNDVTFYQIRSSMRSPFAVTSLDASIVMLPTLISAYVAYGMSDIYLPGNFNIHARCGERITLPRLNSAYGKDAMVPEGELNHGEASSSMLENCQNALAAARTDYKKLIAMP